MLAVDRVQPAPRCQEQRAGRLYQLPNWFCRCWALQVYAPVAAHTSSLMLVARVMAATAQRYCAGWL